MATVAQIADLRRFTNEPTATTYTDTYLGELIDASDSVEEAAAALWREKAAKYAELVDVQEGSSRRSLGDLHEQALSMAASWGSRAEALVVETTRRTRTRQIERP